MPELLSTSLYREVRDPAFFRVLAGKNAPTYVDVLDALDRECTEQPDGLERSEALDIIADVITHHPEYQPDDEEDLPEELPMALPPREVARRVLDHLTRCRWLEEPPRKDWRRRLYFDAHGSTLISALRQIAHPEAAVFTDKITAVCAMLANEPELIERPLQTVDVCLANTRQGLGELRTMQKSVQRLTRRQLEEDTLRGNLALVFEDYAEQIAHGAYAELIRARLPGRLPEAVRRIGERLLDDSASMAEMQTELLRREPSLSAETARARVRQRLDDLAHLLVLVQPMADEIDRRPARLSRPAHHDRRLPLPAGQHRRRLPNPPAPDHHPLRHRPLQRILLHPPSRRRRPHPLRLLPNRHVQGSPAIASANPLKSVQRSAFTPPSR